MTAVEPAVEAAEQAVLERLLAERAVRTVFQPLVSLDSGHVLGYEALDGWRPNPEHEHLPLTVVLELTERALTSQPAQLLQTVARVRALGWGIALDDVGADPASLALLPLVQPDVIKLDLALVQHRASAHIAAVVNAVHAEAERSGTVVLAEGIETEQHLRTARAFGATSGRAGTSAAPARCRPRYKRSPPPRRCSWCLGPLAPTTRARSSWPQPTGRSGTPTNGC